ncbi:MAG: hypothetical protein ACOYK8_09025 [Alphaproteobacteria bacterium]
MSDVVSPLSLLSGYEKLVRSSQVGNSDISYGIPSKTKAFLKALYSNPSQAYSLWDLGKGEDIKKELEMLKKWGCVFLASEDKQSFYINGMEYDVQNMEEELKLLIFNAANVYVGGILSWVAALEDAASDNRQWLRQPAQSAESETWWVVRPNQDGSYQAESGGATLELPNLEATTLQEHGFSTKTPPNRLSYTALALGEILRYDSIQSTMGRVSFLMFIETYYEAECQRRDNTIPSLKQSLANVLPKLQQQPWGEGSFQCYSIQALQAMDNLWDVARPEGKSFPVISVRKASL